MLRIFLFIFLVLQSSYSFAEVKPVLTIELEGVSAGGGLWIDSQDNIYVFAGSQFRKLTKEGIFLKAWGGKGVGDNYFYKPNKISIDSYDKIYVEDYVDDTNLNKGIKIFSADGV